MSARRASALLAAAVLLTACVPDLGGERGVSVEVWFHEADGLGRRLLEEELLRFNQTQSEVSARLRILPEGDYDEQVHDAFGDERLPDLLTLDPLALAPRGLGGELARLDRLLPADLVADLRPDTRRRGTVRGRLLGVAVLETAAVLVADRAALGAIGARLPRDPTQAWTAVELDRILSDLSGAAEHDEPVLDLRADLGERWLLFAYAGLLASAGGGLGVSPPGGPEGLAGPASLRLAGRLQRWADAGWVGVEPAPGGPEPGASLTLVPGVAVAQHGEAFGDALAVVPVPDLGSGSRTVMWGHPWVIPAASEHRQAAAAVLAHLMAPEVAARLAAQGGVLVGSMAVARAAADAADPVARTLGALAERDITVDPPRWPAGGDAAAVVVAGFGEVLSGADAADVLQSSARDLARLLDAAVSRER